MKHKKCDAFAILLNNFSKKVTESTHNRFKFYQRSFERYPNIKSYKLLNKVVK